MKLRHLDFQVDFQVGFQVGLLSSLALGSAALAVTPPTQVTYHIYQYRCDGGKKISASYVNYGKDGPKFVVLNWNGTQYGLAQAISASGARYASLYGPTVAGSGLEWWEAHNTATFSTFVGHDTSKTKVLLSNCVTSNR